jgi:MGT family glycosyltransferase
MSRFLAYTSPARGHLYPLTPVLDELKARAHSVAVRTLPSEVQALRERGLDAGGIDPWLASSELGDYRARTPIGAERASVRTLAERAAREVPDLGRAIEEERPDALLVDINTWGASALAEASGLPWAHFCPYPLPLPSRDVPPFGLGLRPANGRAGRLRDAIVRRGVFEPLARLATPKLNAIRAELGLEPLARATDAFARAPLLVYFTAEPFEYPRSDWPDSVLQVGPCSWEPPRDPPGWLAELEPPLLLVTMSTEYQRDEKLVETALLAFRDWSGSVVATTGPADPARFDVPANARVERFLPHGPIIARASCILCHGGMGITQKALSAGVPVCAVPFGRDQLEVARRLELAGAGTQLSAMRLKPDRLRAAVARAIECRPGAERLARAFTAAGGAPRAADAVEALLGERPPLTEQYSGAAPQP